MIPRWWVREWLVLKRYWRRLVVFWQRGRRGWADEDTWDLHSYVSDVMIGGLRELRARSIGYPAALHEGTPGDSQCLADPAHDQGMERWRAILDEMIEGFEAHKQLADLNYDWKDKDEEVRLRAKVQRGLTLLTEWYGALWD